MTPPYQLALMTAKQAREPHKLLSLAAIEPPTGERALLEIFATYLDDASSYSSCHHIAQMLTDICGKGKPEVTQDDAAVAAAQKAVAGQNLIWIRTKASADHSFVLFAKDNHVECIEGWAGDGENAVPLHQMLFEDWHSIWLTPSEASAALGKVRSDDQPTRLAAWKLLCRSAGTPERAGIFGNEAAKLPIQVTVASVADPGVCTLNFRKRLDATKSWVYYVSAGYKQQTLCRGCLTVRGLKDKWSVCEKCDQGYCDICVRGAAKKVCWLPEFGETTQCSGALKAEA